MQFLAVQRVTRARESVGKPPVFRRLVLAVLAVALAWGVTVAPPTVPSASAEGLTATEAQVCETKRAKVRAKSRHIRKLRRLDRSERRINRAIRARRALRARAERACTVVDGVVVFGDSMTVNARSALPADWDVDALWGRGVTQLTVQIKAWRGRTIFRPRVAVFALGTNEQAGWGKASYEYAISLLPPETPVVFVNTYRPNAGIGTPEDGSLYSGWMAEIAAERPRTAVADWRAAASADHGLMYDNVHQTKPEGITVWAGLVTGAVDRVLR